MNEIYSYHIFLVSKFLLGTPQWTAYLIAHLSWVTVRVKDFTPRCNPPYLNRLGTGMQTTVHAGRR